MQEGDISVSNPNSRTNIWITIFAVLGFVVLALLAYLFFQTKKTVITNSVFSPDPKTYSNPKFFYNFVCPANSIHTHTISNDGDGIQQPFYQETCMDHTRVGSFVSIYVMSVNAEDIEYPKTFYMEKLETTSGMEKIILIGNEKKYFDEVVSSFKFTR